MQIELKRLQKKLGITFVYVTHDQEEALTMSDRIAVMNGGIIDQLAAPMEIYNRPATRFVAGFIGESNIFDGVVKAVDGNLITVETPQGTLQVAGEDFVVGEDIHVSVRPEAVAYSKEPVAGFDLAGNVLDFIYLGSTVKTTVSLKGGFEAKFTRFEQGLDLQEKDALYLFWNPDKAVAIKKS